jgi:prophage regulatory protein
MQSIATAAEPATQPRRLLRFKTVGEITGLSRSELYRLINLGRFPQPVPLGQRIRAFDAGEINSWIEDRISERQQRAA